MPKRYISAEGPIEYPEKLFFIGQSLKCKVMDVDEASSKMTLSLIIGGTSKPLGSKEKKSGQKLTLGSTYKCRVADVAGDGLAVEVGYLKNCRYLTHFYNLLCLFQIELEQGDIVKAHVPKHHLTDHAMLADQLLATYAAGDVVEAVCFERDVVPIMTMKPFIVSASDEEAKTMSFEDLHEGQVLPGKLLP